MPTVRRKDLESGYVIRLRFYDDEHLLTYAEVTARMRRDEAFRACFIEALASMPFRAFRWETPSVTERTVGLPFECVVVDAPGLAPAPEPEPFASHFEAGGDGVVVFPNLGGDTTLVVPCPIGRDASYNHFASFLRTAPDAQKHALLVRVGEAVEGALSSKPLWLSTAGAGVSWLHVRLDTRPKYYSYSPYKAEIAAS